MRNTHLGRSFSLQSVIKCQICKDTGLGFITCFCNNRAFKRLKGLNTLTEKLYVRKKVLPPWTEKEIVLVVPILKLVESTRINVRLDGHSL